MAASICCTAKTSPADIILKSGHVDIAVIYESNSLAWRFNADGSSSESGGNLEGLISPNAMSVRVPNIVNINNAAPGSNNNVTGYSGSGPFYWLPSGGSVDGAPFLGWALDVGGQPGEINLSNWNSNILVQLTAATMPAGGQFSLWGGNAANIYASTFNSTLSNQGPLPNSFSLSSHTHFNWGFTKEGVYDLTFNASGVHRTDGAKSTSSTFRFLVGDSTAVPEPNSMALLMCGLGCGFFARRYLRKITLPGNEQS
jgi:surface-anchored protein